MQTCRITGVPAVPLVVVAFQTEYYFDKMTINGLSFSGGAGPVGVVPMDGVINWSSDNGSRYTGWELCWVDRSSASAPPLLLLSPASPPSPPLLPLIPGVWIVGPCLLTNSGNCVASPNYPAKYGNMQQCRIMGVPTVPLVVAAFRTQRHYDQLLINGNVYSGTYGPLGVVPRDGVISWRSDNSISFSGWELCWADHLPPLPAPLPPLPIPIPPPVAPSSPLYTPSPDVSISGPCVLTNGGRCVASPNYPGKYGNMQECMITGLPAVPLIVVAFQTETSNDIITINGMEFSGTSGPTGVVPVSGVMTWSSNWRLINSGWELCWDIPLLPLPPPPVLTPKPAPSQPPVPTRPTVCCG